MVKESILEVIGDTPLIQLSSLSAEYQFNIYAKLEFCNPGGSIKDRTALNVIQNAMASGKINNKTTIIESSSGNMAVGLAMVCNKLKIRFCAVVDPKTTKTNIEIIKTYGGEIIMVDKADPITGTFLSARLNKVQELLNNNENYFWTNQYNNRDNINAHYYSTMYEIDSELQGKIDYLFIAVSTCGTITGCGEYIKTKNKDTKVIAVDAQGSVIFGNSPSKRLIPGHGAGIVPNNLNKNLIDEKIHITDYECYKGCMKLLSEESIFAGGSSGAIISAVDKYKTFIKKGSNVVVVLADRGERYLDTIYKEGWVDENMYDEVNNISKMKVQVSEVV